MPPKTPPPNAPADPPVGVPPSATGRAAADGAALHQALKRYWGYDTFRPLQREAMACVLAGRDSVVVLPTGGGKSLCYQAPAVCRPGVAVVVSPLISLMKDQVDALTACGIPAAALNSSLSPDERRDVADRLRAGELKLLYAAPERLVMGPTLEFLAGVEVSFVAVDEAHCISAWGHDFRPEYRDLRRLREALPGVAMHAYTATATQRVREDIDQQLGLAGAEHLVGSFDRPNLVYRVQRADKRMAQVAECVQRRRGESGIVYCISRRETESTAEALCAQGVSAAPYHAGLSDDDRRRNQDAFIQGRVEVMVATVAFGMGIDKPDVRFVVHAGMPKSLESYQQESGRAGRDGLEAECLLLHRPGDAATWRRLTDRSDPVAFAGAMKSLDAMAAYATGVTCRHRALVAHFGQDLGRDDCGACDVCLGELETIDDPLTAAQKIVSCVARLGQRFGADYTAKVLTGSAEQRVLDAGHDRLSTYGLLREEGPRATRDWIEQLVGQGYLQKSGDYDVLQITESGLALLKGEATPRLSRPAAAAATPRRSRAADEDWEGVDRGLFESLRTLRADVAHERAAPAYIVFGDTALRDMARLRPTTLEGFARVRGVGAKKLQDLGPRFVGAIAAHCAATGLPSDVEDAAAAGAATARRRPSPAADPSDDAPSAGETAAYARFRAGEPIDDVAAALGRARSTVVGYLNRYLRTEGVTDPTPWVDAQTARRIEQAIEEAGGDRLKPLYEHLGGQVGYDEIRVVATCVANRGG